MGFMKPFPRYTVTYCQYGDTRMKPTDIWTNHPAPSFKAPCKNGAPCHAASPRGSTIRKAKKMGIKILLDLEKTTTGLKNARDRARIPAELCEHIVDICEGKEQEEEQMRIENLPTI